MIVNVQTWIQFSECLRCITWNSSLNGNSRKFVSSPSIHECICYVFDTWLRKLASLFHVMLSYLNLLKWCRCRTFCLKWWVRTLFIYIYKCNDIMQPYLNTFISGNAFRYTITYISMPMKKDKGKMRKWYLYQLSFTS